MSIKSKWGKSVGNSFTGWATEIYPTHLVVNKSTYYLQVLRLSMLRVIRRIDDELKRRERARV